MPDLESRLTARWYDPSRRPGVLLGGLSWLYRGVTGVRRLLYRRGIRKPRGPGLPIIVVGNITVGGTGKTPLVAWLANQLAREGVRCGIVSRGYGGSHRGGPRRVRADDDPALVGDEPLLLVRRTGVPVVICRDRVAAAELLCGEVDCIICDDGLQHLRLRRDVEIAVVDADRGSGNGRLLPAGPLREPVSRLQDVDFVVANGASMTLEPGDLRQVVDPSRRQPVDWLQGRAVDAVAGIGNPERFFLLLQRLGASVERHPFPDHHGYRPEDLQPLTAATVVMTEKDAVKCAGLAGTDWWYLPVVASLDPTLAGRILQRIATICHDHG